MGVLVICIVYFILRVRNLEGYDIVRHVAKMGGGMDGYIPNFKAEIPLVRSNKKWPNDIMMVLWVERVWERAMNRTGSGLYPNATFGIINVEPSSSVTTGC
jgi:hypothetical protein